MRQMTGAQFIMQAAKQLERLNPPAAFGLRQIHQRQRGIKVAQLDHRSGQRGWRRHQRQAGRGNNAKRALSPDDQIDQIIAGIVFLQRWQQVHHLAGGGHHLQPEAQMPRIAIAHNIQPACIGAERAANLRGTLGPEHQRKHQRFRGGNGVQLFDDTAGLGHHEAAGSIHLAHSFHPFQRQQHDILPGRCNCPAGKAGIAAKGNDRGFRLGT